MKNDPHGVAMARAQATDPMAQIDPVDSACALDRPMMHGKYDSITQPEWNHLRM